MRPMLKTIDAIANIPGIGDYELSRVDSAERFFKPAIEKSGCVHAGMTALEIGCGKGLKATVFSDLVERYIGVDLNQSDIATAQQVATATGSKAEFYVANGIEILRRPSSFGLKQDPDFLILYAVLEHLLPHERTEVFAAMRETVERGGTVFFAESPNRLIPFDSHSSQLHFAQSLPPELALRYVQQSKHKTWKYSLDKMGNNREALYRSGLGLSYHDFELDLFPNSSALPFAFTGWCSELLHHQPLQNDEEWLHGYFKNNNLDIHPAFSRYWLEGLISRKAKKIHCSTHIGRFDLEKSNSVEEWICWGHTNLIASSDKPAEIVFGVDNQRGEFELIVQLENRSRDHSIELSIDRQSTIVKIPGEEAKMWHGFRSLSLWLKSAPRTLAISSDIPVRIRAAVLNRYTNI
jgi:2-polyprenyl-3-methyl-5-hydroxy-6-metoxy-1,4-benzoquinol methylase